MKLIGMVRGVDGAVRDVLADEADHEAAKEAIDRRVGDGETLLSHRAA